MHQFMDAADVDPAWELMQQGVVSDDPRLRETQERLAACHNAMGHPENGTLVPACDALDPWCDHLIVRDLRTDSVVGTYRLLPPDRATVAGGCYAGSEFDMSALNPIAGPAYIRIINGAVIGLLWSAVIRYLVAGGYNWLSGCASVPLADSGIQAASVWYQVSGKYLSPESYAVAPHRPWQPDPNSPAIRAAMPPLLRGYLRLGAWVCGPPAHDPVFDCADFFMLLDLRRLSPRHRQHFLGRSR